MKTKRRYVMKHLLSLVGMSILVSCTTSTRISSEVRNQLASSGKMRVAINYGNPVLAKKNPQTGELFGVVVDISRELGRQLSIPVDLVGYEKVAKLIEGLKTNDWDVAFLAIDSTRADNIEFTTPYMEVENTYLVPESSSIHNASDLDRTGIRIAVEKKNAADLFLSKELKHASLVRAPDEASALSLLKSGSANALASSKQRLILAAETTPGYRIVEGRFSAIQHGIGIPKGHSAVTMFVSKFIEEMKTSGFIKRVLEKNRIRGVVVAPPEIVKTK